MAINALRIDVQCEKQKCTYCKVVTNRKIYKERIMTGIQMKGIAIATGLVALACAVGQPAAAEEPGLDMPVISSASVDWASQYNVYGMQFSDGGVIQPVVTGDFWGLEGLAFANFDPNQNKDE